MLVGNGKMSYIYDKKLNKCDIININILLVALFMCLSSTLLIFFSCVNASTAVITLLILSKVAINLSSKFSLTTNYHLVTKKVSPEIVLFGVNGAHLCTEKRKIVAIVVDCLGNNVNNYQLWQYKIFGFIFYKTAPSFRALLPKNTSFQRHFHKFYTFKAID